MTAPNPVGVHKLIPGGEVMRRYRKKRYGRRRRFFLFLLFVLFTFATFVVVFETRIRPVISQVAMAQAQSVAVSAINDEVNRIIASESIQYGDLANLQMDQHSRISAVTADIVEINRLKSEFARCIQEKMRTIDKMTIRIPLGTLVSNGILTGYGPRIPIRLTSIGRAIVDIEDSFLEAGINQTRHEIHLSVTAKMSVLMPGGSTVAEIQTAIPIAQSVIVGEVPDSVTNVSGVNGEPQDNVLNMLN